MGITAKELAKLLDLSPSAVSIALNHKPGVSTATRKLVLETAAQYGYDLSRHTPAPQNTNLGTIYFVIYRKHGAVVTDTPFFAQLSEGIAAKCKELNYYLSIQYLYEDEFQDEILHDWKMQGCVGMILLATEMQQSDLGPFLKSGLPIVLLDNHFDEMSQDDVRMDSVIIDNIQGAFTATSHLLRTYHKQPGYLKSSYSINNFEERADGFYKAIRKNGLSTKHSTVHLLTPSVDGAYEDMKALLESGECPERCYFADNDLIAAGAIRALKEAGYQIPSQVAIIGFDDMPLCTYMEPPLSTMYVPKKELGEVALSRLLSRLGESSSYPAMKIALNTSLRRRRSS